MKVQQKIETREGGTERVESLQSWNGFPRSRSQGQGGKGPCHTCILLDMP
jgi:hypothetical protein